MKKIFDEKIINLEISKIEDIVNKEYEKKETELESGSKLYKGGYRDVRDPVKWGLAKFEFQKDIFNLSCQKISSLANEIFRLYLRHLEDKDLSGEIIHYIKNKIQTIINKQKERLLEKYDIKFEKEKIIEHCGFLINNIERDLNIKKAYQQKEKKKTIQEEEKRFSFISDTKFRRIITRDYIELDKLIKINAEKSILLICGSLIEALLCDLIINKNPTDKSRGKKDFNNKLLPVEEWDLTHLLNVSRDNNLINKMTESECRKIQDYRNLIHPGKELRENRKIRLGDPDISYGALKNLIEELSS